MSEKPLLPREIDDKLVPPVWVAVLDAAWKQMAERLEEAGAEVPPANWTAGVYAAGTRFCLSKDLVSSGVTYP
ncbi:hypothetical protein [Streptomyces broussonetiae]|uniref:hypothetical protein n=1 Tax=Streptomyces broussonetiae TaxID=2686304 RepID=UPI001E5B5F87|nr:hypothetical protein [Streptomyces broussonetiae]